MSKTDKALTAVLDIATRILGPVDRYGHFTFTGSRDGKKRRVKIQDTSWRLEKNIGPGQWVRIRGEYFVKTDLVEFERILKVIK